MVVGMFSLVSGLKINMAKSTLLGLRVNEEVVRSLAESVGCEVGVWPITYMGMPLRGNPCCRSFWELVITKVATRLDGWKRAFLSKGGRLTLTESVLSAIPTYFFCFKYHHGSSRSWRRL